MQSRRVHSLHEKNRKEKEIMKELREQVEKLVYEEYERASKEHGETFYSSHEALGVLWEEVEEAQFEMSGVHTHYNFFGHSVKDNDYDGQAEYLKKIYTMAVNGACELIQVANVAQKAIKSLPKRKQTEVIGRVEDGCLVVDTDEVGDWEY